MGISEYLKKGTKESSMRLVLFVCCTTACLIAFSSTVFYFVSCIMNKTFDLTSVAMLVGTVLGFAITGKVGQSFTEKKQEEPKKE